MKNKLIGLLLVISLIPGFAAAHGYGWGTCWGTQTGFMGGGFMMILWVLVLIIAITAGVKWVSSNKEKTAPVSNARAILSERFAKGEITQQEYETMKKNL